MTLLLFGTLEVCLAGAAAACGTSDLVPGISIGLLGCAGAAVGAAVGAEAATGAGVDVLLALLEELFSSGSSGVCLFWFKGAGPDC